MPSFVPVYISSLHITIYNLTYCPIFAFWVCTGQGTSLSVVGPDLILRFYITVNFSIAIDYTFTIDSIFISFMLPFLFRHLMLFFLKCFFRPSLQLCFPLLSRFFLTLIYPSLFVIDFLLTSSCINIDCDCVCSFHTPMGEVGWRFHGVR